MGSPERAQTVRFGETRTLNSGTKITAIRPEVTLPPEDDIKPRRTAWHESDHIVVADEQDNPVKKATIVPSIKDGYLGLTIPSRPDAAAAIAAHVDGHSGTSHDVLIAGLLDKFGTAARTAKHILRRTRHKVRAVAKLLQRKKTVGHTEIQHVMQAADRVLEQPGEPIKLRIKKTNEKTQLIENPQVQGEKVLIPGVFVNVVDDLGVTA